LSRKVFCATLGCDKNLVDTEALLGRFAKAGVGTTDDLGEADIWVLNSCGFIDASRRDSAETLDEMIRLKSNQTLMVFGCWSQEHGDMIRETYPAVDIVAGVGNFDEVVAACLDKDAAPPKAPSAPAIPGTAAFEMAPPPMVTDPMEASYVGLGDRPLLTPAHVAFVKIAEGCNFNCSFCRIPMIRGKQQSRSVAEITDEVRGLVDRGVTEIQLVSQNTSDFGRDTGENIYTLAKSLDGIDGLKLQRLLYIYAGVVTTDDLLRLLDLRTVAPYLDMPIQHASARILKAMKRPGGEKSSPEFFNVLRRAHPELVLRSTALLGFPGEEEDDVAELADFLAEVQFDHLGTYRYSPEEGTASATLPDRVPGEVSMDREAMIMDLQSEISLDRQVARLGQVHDVVVDRIITDPEELADWANAFIDVVWDPKGEPQAFARVGKPGLDLAVARSYHYGYDLDGVVLMPAAGLEPGRWLKAEFRGVTGFDTWAEPAVKNSATEGQNG